MLEGEQLKRYVDSLERDLNRAAERGVIGRNSKVIASNNRVLDSENRKINTVKRAIQLRQDEADAIEAVNKRIEETGFIEGKLRRARSPKSIEKWTKALEDSSKALEAEKKQRDSLTRARVLAEQTAGSAVRHSSAIQQAATEVKKKAREEEIAGRKELEKRIAATKDAEKALQSYSAGFSMHDALLKKEQATNQHAIDSNRRLTRDFDHASDSLTRYARQHNKLIETLSDPKASSSTIRREIEKTSDAYANMDRKIRDTTKSLREHLVEQAKSATHSPFGRGGRKLPDVEGSLARNLGALTPLGTVTPGLLVPLGAGFFAVAQGAIAASQSVMLLPAAVSAAAAGFGVLQMATMGVSDAFTAMMDFNNPDKFAESLRLLSPATQQFMLSVQQLIPTFMELKNAVQDTFFADFPQLINGLAKTYRDSFGSMAVGVAGAFNGIFKEIGTVLQDPSTQQSMAVMFDGIVKSFQALIPLVGSFTQVFIRLSAAGMEVLPSIVDDLASLMAGFSNFIDKAAASGDLKKWMTEGWEALKALGSVIVYAGKMLYDVFGLHGPQDIERFKTTMGGLIDGFGVFFGTLEKFFYGLSVVMREISDSPIGDVLGLIIDQIGGLETALATLVGLGLVGKLAWSFIKLKNVIGDAVAFGLMKLGLLRAGMTALPAQAAAAGAAGGAAAATAGGAAAGAGLATAGAAAGAGFASKFVSTAKVLIKGAGWIGIGITIADLIGQGIRDGSGGWRDALSDGLDPGKVLNPLYWIDKVRGTNDSGLAGPNAPSSLEALIGAMTGNPPNTSPPMVGGGGDFPSPDTVMGSDGKPYRPVIPGTPGAVPIPGKNQWGVPGAGSPMTGSHDPGNWGPIPDLPYGGFPVPTPNPGGGSIPNIPYGQYSLNSIPLGQFTGSQWAPPDPRSLVSQLTPHQIEQGRTKGYGYVVDPQQVFDKDSALQRQRAAVEEARARVLELQADNQATEQQKITAQHNIIEAERAFIKSQVELLEAQRGTWKKINESIKDQSKMLDGLGAEIDADFGISKGLPGIADNIVKFLANITAAPLYGQLAAQRAAGGELGGGKGLIGMAALSGAFGPQFMQPDTGTVAAPSASLSGAPIPSGVAGAPLAAELGFVPKPGLNPNNVSTSGLKPQSMALLSLIQGMPQFAGIPLTSAKLGREGDPYPWHPSGRGLDLGLNANDPVQSALGDQLNAFLNSNKQLFGIYNTLWKVKDHYNHLHIALNEGNSPLMSGLNGMVPPAAGITSSLTGGGIPIPLPVTIVGGTGSTPGLPTAGSPGVTPPAGTPNGPSPAGNTPIPVPPAGTPGGKPGSTGSMMDGQENKVWTVNPDGTISWRGVNGNPTAAPKGQPGSPATTPPTIPTALPSPGQGGPIRWNLPPLAPAGGDGGLPTAPGGYAPPGTGPSQIGAVVGPPEGTGSGFGGFGGGLLGAAQGAIGAAAGAAGAMGTMGGGGPAAAAAAQIGIEEMNRAIAFAGQAAGIGISGLMETLLPTGGSDLANNNWLTRILGGVVGMRPLLPNFANISGASSDVQNGQDSGSAVQGGPVNITQNNYNPTGNSTTSDLDRVAQQTAAASLPAMGVR